MMHMTFYWGTKVTLLFTSWSTSSLLDYSLSLLACLLFSSFYQYLESRRLLLQSLPPPPPLQTPLLTSPNFKSPWLSKAAGSLLFGLNSALGYLLMLAVMSFNGGVFVAVVVGLSLGYFFFRSHTPVLAPQPQSDGSCSCA